MEYQQNPRSNYEKAFKNYQKASETYAKHLIGKFSENLYSALGSHDPKNVNKYNTLLDMVSKMDNFDNLEELLGLMQEEKTDSLEEDKPYKDRKKIKKSYSPSEITMSQAIEEIKKKELSYGFHETELPTGSAYYQRIMKYVNSGDIRARKAVHNNREQYKINTKDFYALLKSLAKKEY